MQIGGLRHRITIQRYTAKADSVGEEIKEWEDFCDIWAKIEPLRGKEFFQSQTINSEITTRVVIRYIKGISTKMRVIFGERKFDILSVIDVEERKKEMHLMCKELNAEEDV